MFVFPEAKFIKKSTKISVIKQRFFFVVKDEINFNANSDERVYKYHSLKDSSISFGKPTTVLQNF